MVIRSGQFEGFMAKPKGIRGFPVHAIPACFLHNLVSCISPKLNSSTESNSNAGVTFSLAYLE